jgi:2-oxo-4-hydroxy-4-carboxy-5-ureidoimidazoline decarboxylase
MKLEKFNRLPRTEASLVLARCCASSQWVKMMTQKRPFEEETNLFAAADAIWRRLSPEDWQEAFASHTHIADSDGDGTIDATGATQEMIGTLTRHNAEYEKKFGYPFVVFAAGKSAPDVLALLRERLGNTPASEALIAAGEERKIALLRLENLLHIEESME